MSSSLPRVCILTSGVGSRMGKWSRLTNKALLPLGEKAIISHIIGKFPAGTEFVISLGHLGDQVKSYLTLAHPEIRFHFSQVDKFEGTGSGPAYSLLCCAENLPGPFYFVSCDTIWNEPFDLSPGEHSWFAAAAVPAGRSEDYCCFEHSDLKITRIVDKQKSNDGNLMAFSGLCFIADAPAFWCGLRDEALIKNERQISNGIQALLNNGGADVRPISWIDVGNEQQYCEAAQAMGDDFDFSKTDELLYFSGRRVIKFFRDSRITDARYARAEQNPQVFPKLAGKGAGFYAYDKVPGATLYARNNVPAFERLLHWLDRSLWKPVAVEPALFRKACQSFYQDKTLQRVRQYQQKYNGHPEALMANGAEVPPVDKILEQIPWDELTQGIPVFFHGDLQFDNILACTEAGREFCLIDWRQDFAGHLDFGDLYYDLAKLYGGICLNYDYIKKGLFSYQEQGAEVYYDWAVRSNAKAYEACLFAYCAQRKYDVRKIRLLTGLIYLNMSPLHHEPFDKLLFALGRHTLNEVLKEYRL